LYEVLNEHVWINADERQAEDSRRVLAAGGQINASMLQVGHPAVLAHAV
jgi:hypothetical protein